MFTQTSSRFARLVQVGGSLALESSYDRAFVDAFKAAIPSDGRKWDPENKRWLIDPQYADVCAALAQRYLGVTVRLPAFKTVQLAPETKLIRLEYLGRCKDRGNGVSTAFGFADGSWSVVIPEDVLRAYFDSPKSPTEEQTLYSILAVKQTATVAEIRSGHRRLARQWHPDVCHEPDAAEQFKRIQAAYEVLTDTMKRKKYDAGLYFEAQAKLARATEISPAQFVRDLRYDMNGQPYDAFAHEYRSPMRCGYLLVEGRESIGRFIVSAVLQWEDATDAQGRTMVTSWPTGADKFEVQWV